MTLRLAGPYPCGNGDCPYLPGRTWAAETLLALGDLQVAPRLTLPVLGNTFDDATARLPQAAVEPLAPQAVETSSHGRDGLDLFGRLLAAGFRRSGTVLYRPDCVGCAECVSLRVDVNRFTPSGDQRRALRKNRDVTLQIGLPHYTEEKHALYQAFLRARYPGRDEVTREEYERFLVESLGNTREFRYHLDGRLVGLGIVDLTRDAASSVYFFFDPTLAQRSLGTYSALREIDVCRQTSRAWLYLGFRVNGCAAMQYKASYRPHQLLDPRLGWGDAPGAG